MFLQNSKCLLATKDSFPFILQIGLAVGDIENVRKLATVSIFEQQLELIDTLQGIIPKYFLKRFVYVASNTVLVNKQTKWQR